MKKDNFEEELTAHQSLLYIKKMIQQLALVLKIKNVYRMYINQTSPFYTKNLCDYHELA